MSEPGATEDSGEGLPPQVLDLLLRGPFLSIWSQLPGGEQAWKRALATGDAEALAHQAAVWRTQVLDCGLPGVSTHEAAAVLALEAVELVDRSSAMSMALQALCCEWLANHPEFGEQERSPE